MQIIDILCIALGSAIVGAYLLLSIMRQLGRIASPKYPPYENSRDGNLEWAIITVVFIFFAGMPYVAVAKRLIENTILGGN